LLPFIHRGFPRRINIIRENWQFPEGYLRGKKEDERKEEEENKRSRKNKKRNRKQTT